MTEHIKVLLSTLTFLCSMVCVGQIDHWEAIVRDGDEVKYLIPTSQPDISWKNGSFDDGSCHAARVRRGLSGLSGWSNPKEAVRNGVEPRRGCHRGRVTGRGWRTGSFGLSRPDWPRCFARCWLLYGQRSARKVTPSSLIGIAAKLPRLYSGAHDENLSSALLGALSLGR